MTASMGAEISPIGQQHAGQQGQVLLLDGVLQRDAGGGDQDGALRLALCRPALAMQDAGGQVGEGLADAGPASHRAMLPSSMASRMLWHSRICSGRSAIPPLGQ